MMEQMAYGLMLAAFDETVDEWTPDDDLAWIKEQTQDGLVGLAEIIGGWIEEELTTEDALEMMAAPAEAMEETLQAVIEAMRDDGFSQEDIDMLQETMQATLDEIAEAEFE